MVNQECNKTNEGPRSQAQMQPKHLYVMTPEIMRLCEGRKDGIRVGFGRCTYAVQSLKASLSKGVD